MGAYLVLDRIDVYKRQFIYLLFIFKNNIQIERFLNNSFASPLSRKKTEPKACLKFTVFFHLALSAVAAVVNGGDDQIDDKE